MRQIILIPFSAIYFFIVHSGRMIEHEVEKRCTVNEADSIENGNAPAVKASTKKSVETSSCIIRALHSYGKWADGVGKVNMDIPFNRFLAFSFSYLVFLGLVIGLILEPILENHNPNVTSHTRFEWTKYHSFILLYILSMLQFDFVNFYKVRHNHFSNFWRTYDLIFHLLFGVYLILHTSLIVMVSFETCIEPEDHTSKAPSNNSPVENVNDCHRFRIVRSLSGVAFAIGNNTYTTDTFDNQQIF